MKLRTLVANDDAMSGKIPILHVVLLLCGYCLNITEPKPPYAEDWVVPGSPKGLRRLLPPLA